MLRTFICTLALVVACTARPHKAAFTTRRSRAHHSDAAIHRHDATTTLALAPQDWRLPPATSARARLDQWRSTLFSRSMGMYRDIEEAVGAALEPPGPYRFDLFAPFIKCPDNHPPARFGADEKGMGAVLLCADMLQKPDCVVFLSGVGNHTLVLKDLSKHTPCAVVEFSSTPSQTTTQDRYAHINKYLGTQRQQAANPARWTTIDTTMDSLGISRLDLLIVNIEGAEYDVFSEWTLSSPRLPRQVSMELHYDDMYVGTPGLERRDDASNLVSPLHTMSLADMALFMSHLAGAGYGIVSRENNDRVPHATELTLVRVT